VSGIPLLLEGSGLRVLVVGGGAVAARKLGALLDAGAQVRVVASRVNDVIRARAGERLAIVERPYAPGDVGDAELVVAATDDRATNARVASDARAAHRLVSVADAPAEGSFTMMATHRSGVLVVGVSAGGVPGAAARIRDAIARRFDSRYAEALAELVELRRRLLDRRDTAGWRSLSTSVLDAEFCATVESDDLSSRVAPWA
jgi:precorrin-2 dehydrogenase/sirohydrochlorin ferrochelatase